MELPDYIHYSPSFALTAGKSPQETRDILERFTRLPDRERLFLAATNTAEQLSKLQKNNVIPLGYEVALGKIIGHIVLGDVQLAQITELLEKIGVPLENRKPLQQAVEQLLSSLLAARALEESKRAFQPIPPLTQKISDTEPVMPRTSVPGRNIIDLRKPKP